MVIAPIRRVIVTGLVVIAIGEGRKVLDVIETTEMTRTTAIGGFVGRKTKRAASKIETAESTRVSAVQDAAVAEAETAEIGLGTRTKGEERETIGEFVCS